MGKYIDSEAFERRCMFDSNIEDMQDVIYALRDYPAADVAPVRHGKWAKNKNSIVGYFMYQCSICQKYSGLDDNEWIWKPNFCPNCGARMDGE